MSNNFENEFKAIIGSIDKDSYYFINPHMYDVHLNKYISERQWELEKDIMEDIAYESHRERAKRLSKEKKAQGPSTKCVFLTLQTFQNRIQDLDSMVLFCQRIQYLYDECIWCIETGKVPLPDSNLHIHLLGKIKNSRKHKDAVCREWSKLFGTDLRQSDFWNLKQHRDCEAMPSYEQWFEEKLEYFEDEKKGTHQNSIDLGARGGTGFSTAL